MKLRLIIILCFTYLCFSSVIADGDSGKLKQISSEIDKLKTDLKKNQRRHVSLETQLEDNERLIGKLQASLTQIDNQLKNKQAELNKLQKNQGSTQDKLREQQEIFSKQAKAAYILGRENYLKVILNQEDPDKFSRTLSYYHYLNQARVDVIHNIEDTLATIDANQNAINDKILELRQLKISKQQEQKDLNQTQQQRQNVLSQLEQQINDNQQKLDKLLADKANLEKVINHLPTQPKAKLPASAAFSTLRHKLEWPTKGTITERFGSDLAEGHLKWHGVVIKAKAGQAVNAIAPGQVVFADWMRGFGLLLIVDHGDGYMSLYARNQSLFKKVGDTVSAGDEIATLGNSGGFDTPSLYFEIRHNGTPVNPALWCHG